MERLKAHWNEAGENWGTAIVRRIVELHDMLLFDNLF
jgi:hypothetical protein